MYSPLQQFKEGSPNHSHKIRFQMKVFGKPTKNRTDDPSMFQLLAWNNNGLEPSNFKKNQRFTDPQSAYVNMISKQPWTSQCQQSYLNHRSNSINVNEQVFQEVQNYIQGHQSKNKQKQHIPSPKNGKKNRGQSSQNHKCKKDNYFSPYQQRIKVSSPKHRNDCQVINSMEKQNYQGKQKQMMRRPSSARISSNFNSPKGKTNRQDSFPNAEGQYEQSMIRKREGISQQEQQKLIQKFKQTTRWIPNSAFTTYFGKPPFQNYGRGNTKPVDGGLVYGTYLYSHNVYPHRGTNVPANVQSYPVALMKAKSMGRLIPTQPKTSCKFLQNKINNQKQRQYDGYGAIQAQKNTFQPLQIEVPDLHGVQKFGGTKTTTSKANFYYNTLNQKQPSGHQGNKYSKKRL